MTAVALSRRVLKFDGGFLLLAGRSAMIIETIGHFLGVGSFAHTKDSRSTIGGFEAHGLAIIFGVFLIRTASLSERSLWHQIRLSRAPLAWMLQPALLAVFCSA